MENTITNYDSLLKDIWNENSADVLIGEEQVWDICRIFESAGMLKGNTKFVGVRTIGPFHIAYKDVSKMDILTFFATELMPALISYNKDMKFEDVYGFFLCPAAMFCAKAINDTFLIKDPLEWEILLLIRKLNKKNVYPSPKEVILLEELQNFDKVKIYNACRNLTLKTSFFDKNQKLINQNHDGRLECTM